MKLKNIVLSIVLASSFSTFSYAEDVPFSQELVVKAKDGDAIAQNDLGEAYYYGYETDKDFVKALEWYKKSAAKGNADALFSVGYMLDKAEGTEEDNPSALKWYTQAAQKDQLHAQYYLAYLYLYGDSGVSVNTKKGLEWVTKAADAGLDLAQAELGHLYYNGEQEGIPQDLKKALYYYQLAVEQDESSAINNLGILYLEGKAGLTRDYKEAMRLFTRASEAEYGLGSSNIGYMFEEAKGVSKNYKKAAEYYSLAVEQGDHSALLDLVRLYQIGGFGLTKSLTKATEYQQQWQELQTESE